MYLIEGLGPLHEKFDIWTAKNTFMIFLCFNSVNAS